MSFKNYVENIPDSTAISASSNATMGAALTGFLSWLGSINWVGLISVLVAVIGLAANIYFMWRRDRREKRLLEHNIKGARDEQTK